MPGAGVDVLQSRLATLICARPTLAIVAANEAAATELGWPDGALEGMALPDLWQDEASGRAELDRAARGGPFARWVQRTRQGTWVEVEAAVSEAGDRWLVQIVRVHGEPTGRQRILERLAPILDVEEEGISIIDGKGCVEYISAAAERLLGRAPNEMVGRSGGGFALPGEADRQRAAFHDLLREPGSTRNFLGQYRARDGSERWIETTVTNLLADPTTRGIVIRFRNVTERVLAERRQQEARLRLESLLSATSAVIYSCSASPPYGVTFISDNITSVLGYAPQSFVDEPGFWADRIHPDERGAILAGVERVFTDGRCVHEYRFRHADGSYRWMHDDVVLVRGAAGQPPELMGCFYDVTSRRQAEASVQSLATSLRVLMDNLPVAMLIHRDGVIVYANAKMAEVLGYADDELVGRPALSVVSPQFRQAAHERTRSLESAVGVARTSPADGEMLRADGRALHVIVEGLRLDFDGGPASVVLAQDVTERKEMIARLAASERLASVGMLAAGVAHEINNPLAYVQTTFAILAREVPTWTPGPQARLSAGRLLGVVDDANDGITRIGRLVRDLRSLSHPDEDSLSSIDIREVMRTCLHMAENQLRDRARVVTDFGEVPPIDGNHGRLNQVFLNLLINALHALPDGGPGRNEIRLATYLAASGKVVAEVTDTGCGIPASVLGHIFDPFFTTKPVGVGTGLGLAISRSIIKNMGGEITVVSEVGRGTTFTIQLSPSGRADDRRAKGPVVVPVRRRILVLEDEPALVMLLRDDHDVVAVTAAAQALERIREGAVFDVILCDLTMPRMKGMEFYSELGRSAPPMARKIVFMTGGAFTPETRAFLEHVANPRIEKPFTVESLLGLIEKVCVD